MTKKKETRKTGTCFFEEQDLRDFCKHFGRDENYPKKQSP